MATEEPPAFDASKVTDAELEADLEEIHLDPELAQGTVDQELRDLDKYIAAGPNEFDKYEEMTSPEE